MSPRSAYCRHRAEECERVAEDVNDLHFKSLYLGLMNEWRALARQIETFDLDAFHLDPNRHRVRQTNEYERRAVEHSVSKVQNVELMGYRKTDGYCGAPKGPH